jgi:serine palmitoyltransferase
MRAIETLRKYGVGSCAPAGFYGAIGAPLVRSRFPGRELFCFADVHMDLERHRADFLGTESSILCSQGLSTIPCVIPAFENRGDIIVADRGINFAILKFFVVPFAVSIIMTSKFWKTCS